jgi:hypothetical protein
MTDRYKIVSRRGVGSFTTGQIVDGSDLAGVNLEALLAGGHIVIENNKPKPTAKAGEED